MRYPEFIKKGDTIAVTAPSMGIVEPDSLLKYENAIKNIKDMGFNFLETKNVRSCEKGRSSSAEERAKQFMNVWKNPNITAIICAGGGDFACEMLDYLNFEELKTLEPKWLQGFSDITNLGFLFTTNLDIATMYSETIKDYGMLELFKNLTDTVKIMQGEEVIQESFDKYEPLDIERDDILASYKLTEKSTWKNLFGEKKINFSGRCIGGCFDVIVELIGTKYDKVKKYIEKYKEDGIVWFFDIYEQSTPSVYRHLWQMKNAGYFENCKGIIFGRPAMLREEYEITLADSIKDAFKDMNIPIILDADIGHIPPQMPIVNGAILDITSENGKGVIKTFLR